MEKHDADAGNDLSDLERRLEEWRPDHAGLNPDAMLFAAGMSVGRSGRVSWAMTSGVWVMTVLGLGFWGLAERGERQTLAAQLARHGGTSESPSNIPDLDVARTPASHSPDSFLSLRRSLEQDPDRWLAMAGGPPFDHRDAPLPERSILKSGQRDGALP